MSQFGDWWEKELVRAGKTEELKEFKESWKPGEKQPPVIIPALLDEYKRRYGSLEGFADYLANEPFSIIGDGLTIASLGGYSALGAGRLVAVPGRAARVANIAKTKAGMMTKADLLKAARSNKDYFKSTYGFQRHARAFNKRMNDWNPRPRVLQHVPDGKTLDFKNTLAWWKRMPFSEKYDAAMVMVNAQNAGLRHLLRTGGRSVTSAMVSPNEMALDRYLGDLYKKHGIKPPPSNILGARGTPYLRHWNYSLQKGDPKIVKIYNESLSEIDKIGLRLLENASPVRGAHEQGLAVADAYQSANKANRDALQGLYKEHGKAIESAPVYIEPIRNVTNYLKGEFSDSVGVDKLHPYLRQIVEDPNYSRPEVGGGGPEPSGGKQLTPEEQRDLQELTRMDPREGYKGPSLESVFQQGGQYEDVADWLVRYYGQPEEVGGVVPEAAIREDPGKFEQAHAEAAEAYGSGDEQAAGMLGRGIRARAQGRDINADQLAYLGETVRYLRRQMPELNFVPDHVLLAGNTLAEIKYPEDLFVPKKEGVDYREGIANAVAANYKRRASYIANIYRKLDGNYSTKSVLDQRDVGLREIDDELAEGIEPGARLGDQKNKVRSGKGATDVDRGSEYGIEEEPWSAEGFDERATTALQSTVQSVENRIKDIGVRMDEAKDAGNDRLFDRLEWQYNKMSESLDKLIAEEGTERVRPQALPKRQRIEDTHPELARDVTQHPVAREIRKQIEEGAPPDRGLFGNLARKMEGGFQVQEGSAPLRQGTDADIERRAGEFLNFGLLAKEDLDFFRQIYPQYKNFSDDKLVQGLQWEYRQAQDYGKGSFGRSEQNVSPFPETERTLLDRLSDYRSGQFDPKKGQMGIDHLKTSGSPTYYGMYSWLGKQLEDMPHRGSPAYRDSYRRFANKFGLNWANPNFQRMPSGRVLQGYSPGKGKQEMYYSDPGKMREQPTEDLAEAGSPFKLGEQESQGLEGVGIRKTDEGIVGEPAPSGNAFLSDIRMLEEVDAWDDMDIRKFSEYDPFAQDLAARVYGGYRGEQRFYELPDGQKTSYFNNMLDNRSTAADRWYNSRHGYGFDKSEASVDLSHLEHRISKQTMFSEEPNIAGESRAKDFQSEGPETDPSKVISVAGSEDYDVHMDDPGTGLVGSEFRTVVYETYQDMLAGRLTREAFDKLPDNVKETVWPGYNGLEDAAKAEAWNEPYDDPTKAPVDEAAEAGEPDLEGLDALDSYDPEVQKTMIARGEELQQEILAYKEAGWDQGSTEKSKELRRKVYQAGTDKQIDPETVAALRDQIENIEGEFASHRAPEGAGDTLADPERAKLAPSDAIEVQHMIEEFLESGKTGMVVRSKEGSILRDIDNRYELDERLRNVHADGMMSDGEYAWWSRRLHGVGNDSIVHIPAGHLDNPQALVGSHGIQRLEEDAAGQPYFIADVNDEVIRGYGGEGANPIFDATKTEPGMWWTDRMIDYSYLESRKHPIRDTLAMDVITAELEKQKQEIIGTIRMSNLSALEEAAKVEDGAAEPIRNHNDAWYNMATWTDDDIWGVADQYMKVRGNVFSKHLMDFAMSDDGISVAEDWFSQHKDTPKTPDELQDMFLNSEEFQNSLDAFISGCLLYTSPSPRDS